MAHEQVQELRKMVWDIADILRGPFKQSEYGKVILPFVVMRRLDCILEKTKKTILQECAKLPEGIDDEVKDIMLFEITGVKVYNYSKLTFDKISTQNQDQIRDNLIEYITSFNEEISDTFSAKFSFPHTLEKLDGTGVLWSVFQKIHALDLHPTKISNMDMGYLFEDLIRRFSEISNDTAGEHFTPREIVHLIVDLLLINDEEALSKSSIIRHVYDPACGTGGMLAVMESTMRELNSDIKVELFGQQINGESFAICQSDMLITGHDPSQIAFGNTLTDDKHKTDEKGKDKKFHYMLCNPPYGVDWKEFQNPIKAEFENEGYEGRFGAGLPRVSDGQLLFLQHMISKMRYDEAGSRIGIVMNASPLFSGKVSSGESEIRRWMFENDWIEAIIALPEQLFYNTPIQTYVWILSNKKSEARKGKLQLIDANNERFWQLLPRNLGKKRREIPEKARNEIVRIYSKMLNGSGEWGEYSKIIDNEEFSYTDTSKKKEKIGYEINFKKYFYNYTPPRPAAEIKNELKHLEIEIANLLKDI